MLTRRLTTILPAMTLAEAIGTTRINHVNHVAGRTGGHCLQQPILSGWPTTMSAPCIRSQGPGKVMLTPALEPFRNTELRRLAFIFAVVYFAQRMEDLSTQSVTFTL
jgi:hypothetical protein